MPLEPAERATREFAAAPMRQLRSRVARSLWAPVRWLLRLTWFRHVDPAYRQAMVTGLDPLVDDARSLLDMGCGDGALAAALMARHPGLFAVGVEVGRPARAWIPIVMYDGHRMPFRDRSFDIVMATDVLHHTDDIPRRLREMARVSRRFVLIKDHAVYGVVSRAWIGLIDFLTNVPFGVPCAYNYPTLDQWSQHFHEAGLQVIARSFLPLGAGSRFHPVFKLSVEGGS